MYVVKIIMCLCHVTLLNSDSSMDLDSQVVEICRDSLFLLRAYSFGLDSIDVTIQRHISVTAHKQISTF